jgi:hypothetical protein
LSPTSVSSSGDDTGVRAIRLQLHVDGPGIHIRQDRKNGPRVSAPSLTLKAPTDQQQPSLYRLLKRYLSFTGGLPEHYYLWRLPDDTFTESAWGSCVDTWLKTLLDLLGIQPPPGVIWTQHSLRSGGATASLSIGVDPFTLMRWGMWANPNSVTPYLDPLALPCPAALCFFSHLLKPSLADMQREFAQVPLT